MKPVIGITASLDEKYAINDQNYAISVVKAGGIPVILPPLKSLNQIDSVLARIDGLILSGGQDISPFLYNQEPHPKTSVYSERRDAYEIALYHSARHQNIPVLAICRGLQLINAVHGGSLVQDIVDQRPESLEHVRPNVTVTSHSVKTEIDSFMRKALGESITINSLHHQCVDEVGEGLRVTARSEDDMVEALEDDQVIAVQFHPERLHERVEFLAIFEELIRRAK